MVISQPQNLNLWEGKFLRINSGQFGIYTHNLTFFKVNYNLLNVTYFRYKSQNDYYVKY